MNVALSYLVINIREKELSATQKCFVCDERAASDVEINGKTYRICDACGCKVPISRGQKVQAVYPRRVLAGESTAEFYFTDGA